MDRKFEAFAITPLRIIFRYSDGKGVKSVWALTHVVTHTRSSAGNKRGSGGSSGILVVKWFSFPYKLINILNILYFIPE